MVLMFLGTGCGKSGTIWVSELLNRLGFACLHEKQFTPRKHGPLLVPEVSWLAVPYLGELDPDVKILHIVRNPYDVVRSAMKMMFLSSSRWSRYEDFVVKHLSEVKGARDHLGRVIRWVALWDEPVLDQVGMTVHPDRDSDKYLADRIADITGEPVDVQEITTAHKVLGPVHVSPKARRAPSRAEIDRHQDGALIRERYKFWGYVDGHS